MSFEILDDDDLCYLETNDSMYHTHEKNILLRKRNDVLSTLCGFAQHDYVVNSILYIQAFVRGWILRNDKIQFERCISNTFKYAKMTIQKRRFKKAKLSALKIQSYIRGHHCRKTGLAHAIQKINKYKQNITELELLVLRLTNIAYQPYTSTRRN